LALTPGTRLGPYEVLAQIGVGGMGEVYKATDINLKRAVAIKVLPTSVAADGDRLARFQREGEVLASLNHPNIAAIYGLERSGVTTALVMELVEGPTLANRITRGPIPIDEALPIAKQIAEALEAAHEQSIIHRDLKPANIKLRLDGTVKVLDFGLAKVLDRSAGRDESGTPTVAAEQTHTGVVMGTAAYMSPEQARGQMVDKRTDIWAFGCVLYEMLTGQRAFAGGDQIETLAAVTHKEPAWDSLPSNLPRVVESFLRRSLAKNPARRLRDIGDMRLVLEGDFELAGTSAPAPRRRWFWWSAAAVALAAAVAGIAAWSLKPSEIRSISRFSHVLPADQAFTQLGRPLVAMSTDGTSLAYVANNRLYRRETGELDAVPIRGTDGAATTPFFSPDGQSVGYWDAGAEQLRRVAVSGGTPVTLAPVANVYGASWGSDGFIVYGQEDGIWRIPASGGVPEHVVRINPSERVHGPRMLPDGRTLLFTLQTRALAEGQPTAWDTAHIVVQSLATGERKQIASGSDARYVPTGHVVYALNTVLFALPFDDATLEVSGGPVPILEAVQRAVQAGGSSGSANYDFSATGMLAYVPAGGRSGSVPRSLLAVDQQGNSTPLLDERLDYWRPRISPDGKRVAVEVLSDSGAAQIWVADLDRRTASRLTSEGENAFAAWSPDGQSLIYRGRRSGIYRQLADGSGGPVLLIATEPDIVVTDVSRDGIVAFSVGPQTGLRAIRTFRLEDKLVSDFLDTPAREHMGMFSPDGKWLAYVSNESGEDEVYVRPYPKTEGVGRRVSVGGGAAPVWAPDGSTLYYRRGSATSVPGDLMAVPTTLTPGFTAGRPRSLFRFGGRFRASGNASAYDIHPDGRRFIMVSEPETPVTQTRQINIVVNWFDELKGLVPTK
jgi:serine/threonine-protein kinase